MLTTFSFSRLEKDSIFFNMKIFWYVMYIDFEDPDWSDVEFVDLSREDCVEWIQEKWGDYVEGGPETDEAPSWVVEFDERIVWDELKLQIRNSKDDDVTVKLEGK